MTLLDLADQPESLTAKMADYFRARPHQDIDGKELAQAICGYAWRTEVSRCRQRFGMVITNRLERYTGSNGQRYTKSLYRFEPKEPA